MFFFRKLRCLCYSILDMKYILTSDINQNKYGALLMLKTFPNSPCCNPEINSKHRHFFFAFILFETENFMGNIIFVWQKF